MIFFKHSTTRTSKLDEGNIQMKLPKGIVKAAFSAALALSPLVAAAGFVAVQPDSPATHGTQGHTVNVAYDDCNNPNTPRWGCGFSG
jgi:hypothetical protein